LFFPKPISIGQKEKTHACTTSNPSAAHFPPQMSVCHLPFKTLASFGKHSLFLPSNAVIFSSLLPVNQMHLREPFFPCTNQSKRCKNDHSLLVSFPKKIFSLGCSIVYLQKEITG
uniref:Uncharacterized protein n=1 Tax=Aegilops tauschii subsp. strangulata TaxID=200361 RepID=A0A453EAW7_AEGTS